MTSENKAPDRIWATEDRKNFGEDRFHSTRPMTGLTEYVRADLYAAQAAEIARLTAERDRFEAALGRACLVGGTTYLLDRAEKAEAERDAAQADAEDWARKCAAADEMLDAALAGAVKVKPLVWFEMEKSRHGGKYTADGYTIRYIEGLWLLDFAGKSKSIWRFPTLDAAQLAAQADYEARIRAALQPDPEGRQADLAKAWMMGREDAAGAAKHAGLAFGYERAVQAIRALTPPADLAAKIGGE